MNEQLGLFGRSEGEALNVGTGEGDYDHMVSQHVKRLISCDINQDDLDFAKQFNADVPNVNYEIQDAMNLSYQDNRFELLVCLEVIEHVPDSVQLVKEWARVLAPNGTAIVSFPSNRFPFTYDPINRILQHFGTYVPIGAYGYGHWKLIDPTEFEQWIETAGFEIVQKAPLSSYFSSAFEFYYPSIIQSLLKPNSGNAVGGKKKKLAVRPSRKDSWLGGVTDILISIDKLLFGWSSSSVNIGYVLRKK